MLEIKNVTLGYKGKPHLIEHLSIQAPQGQLIGLLGRNGVGKSTLLRSVAGMTPPLDGEICVDGRSIFTFTDIDRSQHIAFVSTEIVAAAHLRVWDVVALGRMPYTGWLGSLTESDKAKVRESLELVSMGTFAERAIESLSDGERQRVMIARALAQDTPLVLLDEPTAFLDLPNRYQIAILLKKLAHATGKTIIYSSHDLSTAIQICDSLWLFSTEGVAVGEPRELAAQGSFDVIFRGTSLGFDALTGQVRINDSEILQ